jgi:NAD(P)-dependent dehydrogenase (short-subunit alcohol dehydrogenase family)
MSETAGPVRHAVVTGGGRGIGAAISQVLVAAGMRVTLMGRDAATLEATRAMLGAHGAVTVDVTDEDSVAAAFTAAVAANGPIEVLVNNAGIADSAPLQRTTTEAWRRLLAVNLDGVFFCCREAIAGMRERKWGRIVNVASICGLRGYPYIVAYTASKHGVIGVTRALALEVAREGITVNAVCPGYADTDMTESTLANIQAKTGRSREEALAELTKMNPQRRLVTPGEVAASVAWLCAESSASVTGQALVVAGGEVM